MGEAEVVPELMAGLRIKLAPPCLGDIATTGLFGVNVVAAKYRTLQYFAKLFVRATSIGRHDILFPLPLPFVERVNTGSLGREVIVWIV
jgi:hypothetical protein